MDDTRSSSAEAVYEARFCAWTDLSYTECEELLVQGLKPDQLKTMLKEMMKLAVAMETNSQVEIAAELYAHGVVFARRSKFSPIQLSTFVSMLKRVHEACISTPFDNQDAAMKLLQELTVKHCVERPPYSSAVFSFAQAKDITEYMLMTYFKHYKLYKYAFTKKVQMDLCFGEELEQVNSADIPPTEDMSSPPPKGEDDDTENDQPDGTVSSALSESGMVAVDTQEQGSQDTTPENKLQILISGSITEKLQQLQVTIEEQMTRQEEELLARITNLEQSATEGKSKNKKSK